ncbi:MAG TPA: hypothetical protein VLX68_00685 [Chitinivibrionales bacterium]|nr:hypothetical protein [Chitinivibrionales bacterium]
MKRDNNRQRRSFRRFFAIGIALLAGCAGYKYITLSDLDYRKCWLRNPDCGLNVWAVKQPLYETKNNACYQASLKKNVGVFVVKIENAGSRPIPIDSAHLFVLDGSGNPARLLPPDTVAKLLGGGEALKMDVASNPPFGKFLESGKSYIAFVCTAVQGDPYFATYFLRFKAEDGKVITEARF